MRDGLHEVGLPESGVSVDEKWIVNSSRCLTYGISGCGCELVGLSNDKEVEGIAFTERRGAGSVLGLCWPCRRWRRSDEKIHLRSLLSLFMDPERDSKRMT